MKKLALIAGAAALVLPVAAGAKGMKESDSDHNYTYKKVEPMSSSEQGEYRIELQTEEDFRTNPANRVSTFSTVEGEKLIINGKAVYKQAANGERFYAPNGAYKTSNNLTVVVEDGLLKRIEEPAEIVTMN